MLLKTLILLSCLVTTLDLSPIGEDTKIRLHTVQDGVDNRGEGFAALLQHVTTWEGAGSSLNPPDTAMLLSEPELFRGSIFFVSGVVELVETLPAPWDGVQELFIRDEAGQLFGLYVSSQTSIPLHQSLQTPALFYKTISMKGRDDQMRVYPTFVTSSHVMITSAKQQLMPSAFLAIVLFAFVVFVFYWVVKLTRRKRQLGPRRIVQTQDVLLAANETAGELPENPSKALGVMYDHSEGAK